jgi:hypothetical protein
MSPPDKPNRDGWYLVGGTVFVILWLVLLAWGWID